jgi:hypothetical protein
MTLAEKILQEIEQLPPEQQRAVLDFVAYLKLHGTTDALFSEQALRAEWDNPEEDKAWAHLQPKQ